MEPAPAHPVLPLRHSACLGPLFKVLRVLTVPPTLLFVGAAFVAPPALAQGTRVLCANYLEVMSSAPYPEEAALCGLEGQIELELTITTGGETRSLKVARSSHQIFNQPSLETAAKLKCSAAEKDTRVRVPVNFTPHRENAKVDQSLAAACVEKLRGQPLDTDEKTRVQRALMAKILTGPSPFEPASELDAAFRSYLYKMASIGALTQVATKIGKQDLEKEQWVRLFAIEICSLYADGLARLPDEDLIEFLSIQMAFGAKNSEAACAQLESFDLTKEAEIWKTLPPAVLERTLALQVKAVDASMKQTPVPAMPQVLQDQALGAIMRILNSAATRDPGVRESVKRVNAEQESHLDTCRVNYAIFAGIDSLEASLKPIALRVALQQQDEKRQ